MAKRYIILFIALIFSMQPLSCDGLNHYVPETNSVTNIETNKKDDLVSLDWYVAIWGDTEDSELVYNKVNEIMKQNLNIDLKIHASSYYEYNNKISTMLNAGQKMDILFCSDSIVPFLNNVRNGNFLALEELLPQYAPKTWAGIPDAAWQAVTSGGHIYGVIPLKDLADCYSMNYDKQLIDELGLIPPKSGEWQTMFDLLDFLYKGKAARDARYPEQAQYPAIRGGNQTLTLYFPYEPINFLVGANIEGSESFSGKGHGELVFNVFDTPEYLKYAQTLRKMVVDGIYPYDWKNFDREKRLNIKYILIGTQGMVTDDKTENPNYVVTLPKQSFMYSNYVRMQITAITTYCKYPDRAMQAIEYVNQDKLVSTMLRFGIKDVHWRETGTNQITFEGTANQDALNRRYYFWYGTTFGSMANIMLPISEDPFLVKKIIDMTEHSNQKSNLGFIFNETAVVNELAACRSVVEEYEPVIQSGMAENVEAIYAEFVEKLKTNGSERIVTEVQNQLNAWRKTVGR
ncbi:MAG: ABC transporter substrate-binding protein [Clostridiaceae bacterium]|nr:ABC transporter substrate-binding protein [Clostridiaceae bacterium]